MSYQEEPDLFCETVSFSQQEPSVQPPELASVMKRLISSPWISFRQHWARCRLWTSPALHAPAACPQPGRWPSVPEQYRYMCRGNYFFLQFPLGPSLDTVMQGRVSNPDQDQYSLSCRIRIRILNKDPYPCLQISFNFEISLLSRHEDNLRFVQQFSI